MDQAVKAKWVAALRSGEYKQAKGALKDGGGFCCLGVLCDLHSKETGRAWDDGRYLGAEKDLPDEVREWAGGYEPFTKFRIDHDFDMAEQHNDNNGYTFAQIADAIEGQL